MAIDILIARHEEKAEGSGPKPFPGSAEDRQVPISKEGSLRAFELGKNAFSGASNINRWAVYVSDHLRTQQTADDIILGRANTTRNMMVDSGLMRYVVDSGIGLSGYNWRHPRFTQFSGNEQAALDGFVNALIEKHWLPEDGPVSNLGVPVAAQMAYGLMRVVVDGVEYLAHNVHEGEDGRLLVVTHAPLIDMFAAAFIGVVDYDADDSKTGDGRNLVGVTAERRLSAHNLGQYITGKVDTQGKGGIFDPTVGLLIKGERKTMKLDAMREIALDLLYHSTQSVQKAK